MDVSTLLPEFEPQNISPLELQVHLLNMLHIQKIYNEQILGNSHVVKIDLIPDITRRELKPGCNVM